ncbi:MAG: DinB family protein [Sphingobacteriaceae bacterium]|nr:MAG: DinB family protein [Sphingobacteriaceae bacterium]
MAAEKKQEVWLRGPIDGVTPLLQPVAHALLQAREELNEVMVGFPEVLLWVKPMGMASVGFHLQHLTGVIGRLFTYARGEALSKQQLDYLQSEGKMPEKEYTIKDLVGRFNKQVDKALKQLSQVDAATLIDAKGVGRAQLPSTGIGLYTHSAEHTMRHLGQLMVTVGILKSK